MNLVRVEVPRSAMIALGLDVSADRAEELVEADVMLGSNGDRARRAFPGLAVWQNEEELRCE